MSTTDFASNPLRIAQAAAYQLSALPEHDRPDVLARIHEKVLKGMSSFDASKASFETWVNTIARNAVIDWLRARKCQPLTVSLEEQFAITDQYSISTWDDLTRDYVNGARNAIYTAIDRMDGEMLRQYLIARFLLVLSYERMAEMFEVDEATVRSNMRRALAEFSRVFKDTNPQFGQCDIKKLAQALTDGAVAINDELLEDIAVPSTKAVLSGLWHDRWPMTAVARTQGIEVSEAIKRAREGLGALLRSSIKGTTHLLEPRAGYEYTFDSLETLLFAAMKPQQ